MNDIYSLLTEPKQFQKESKHKSCLFNILKLEVFILYAFSLDYLHPLQRFNSQLNQKLLQFSNISSNFLVFQTCYNIIIKANMYSILDRYHVLWHTVSCQMKLLPNLPNPMRLLLMLSLPIKRKQRSKWTCQVQTTTE